MVKLFRTAPEEFTRRSDSGQEYFHGPRQSQDSDVPPWLDNLVETVAGNMEAISAMGPLVFRYGEEEGFWEVILYPSPVELVGGAVDGEVVAPGFTLDLEGLRSAFEKIDAFSWNSIGFHDGERPYIAIEGEIQGQHVYLQVLAYAPEDEEPGMKLDCTKSGG
jgi:hypothetical protein